MANEILAALHAPGRSPSRIAAVLGPTYGLNLNVVSRHRNGSPCVKCIEAKIWPS